MGRIFADLSHAAKPRIDQELIDDEKFQQKLEANKALVCPGCGRSSRRMHPKYWVNYVANDLMATMICRKCKRKLRFATYIEEEFPEDDEEDEPEDEAPFGFLVACRQGRCVTICANLVISAKLCLHADLQK